MMRRGEERKGNDRGKDGPTGPELKYQYHPVTPWTTQGSTGALVRGVLDTPLRVLGTTSPQQLHARYSTVWIKIAMLRVHQAKSELLLAGARACRWTAPPLPRNSTQERRREKVPRSLALHTSDFFLDYCLYLFLLPVESLRRCDYSMKVKQVKLKSFQKLY